jgi:hypothetical protein
MDINNNIQETLVSFEIAKLLKEAGFDVPCQKWYSNEGSCYYENEFNNCRGSVPSFYCEAPTQQLAIDWIRINFGIHIQDMIYRRNPDDFLFVVYYNKTEKYFSEPFDTPEEAKEAALLYTLQNLIK